jgi:hypothetical protein
LGRRERGRGRGGGREKRREERKEERREGWITEGIGKDGRERDCL